MPMTLEPKEGLAMVNGTNFMTAVGVLALQDAHRLGVIADACTALATEALRGIDRPFDPFLPRHRQAASRPRSPPPRVRAVFSGAAGSPATTRRSSASSAPWSQGYRRLEAKIRTSTPSAAPRNAWARCTTR